MKIVIRIFGLTCIILSLFYILGIVLYSINVYFGLSEITKNLFLRAPFYIALFIAGWNIVKLRKWAVYLLFGLLFYDILYWFIPGFYQRMFTLLGTIKSPTEKAYILFVIFYKRFFIPTILFIFFLLPKVKEQFKEEPPIRGPFDE